MCGINPNTERLNAELLGVGVGIINELIGILRAEGMPKANESDVLATATIAYQQGKITKSQYIAVINALDEHNYHRTWNAEYIEANNYLNQYR